LILASQSLQLISAIIPYISKTLANLLTNRQQILLNQFDQILVDYRNNQEQVHLKIIEMMTDRMRIQATSFLELDWDMPNPREIEQELNVTLAMFNVVKETVDLYSMLQKYMSTDIIKVSTI
jgi:vacuolar protein sorting-associated protein 54